MDVKKHLKKRISHSVFTSVIDNLLAESNTQKMFYKMAARSMLFTSIYHTTENL